VVTLTATPQAGWSFSGWSGDLTGTTNPATITMSANRTVTATFIQNAYALTVNVTGSGSVGKSPDQASYAHGTVVTLTATPATGWSFSGWSGDLTGTTNPATITMSANRTVTATFTQNTYTLTANVVGSGSVGKNPDQTTYTYGQAVTLTATPQAGWSFTGWSGDLTGTTNPATITMDAAKTVTATFIQNMYTLAAGNDGHGTVTLNPAGGTYAHGTTVTLTPNPVTGYQFSSWSGTSAADIINTSGVYTIVMTGNKTVQANFIVLAHIPAVQFWATPTKGFPALSVKFMDDSEGNPTAWLWDFGDGQTSTERNPSHVYWLPGRYSVTLTITTQFGTYSLQKEKFIYVGGFEFCPCATLDLIDNSASFSSENWNNAIDHDVSGLDGTVTAGGVVPYAIFKFHDNKTKSINKIRLLTDSDVGMQDRWVLGFDVMVSTTGLADGDFSLLMRQAKKGGDWEEYPCTPKAAKYIKLVLTNPGSGWRQLGEFEVCVVKEYPDIAKSSVKVTSPHIANGVDAAKMTITLKKSDGTALSGVSSEEFFLYSSSGAINYSPVTESATPGVYTTAITTIEQGAKEIKVIVICNMLGSVTTNFTSPVLQESPLVFVEGSTAFKNEGWDNLIDGDEEGWDGTATVGGTEPFAIFSFADGSIKAVQKLALLMDTGVGFSNRWVQRFRLQASTTGKSAANFVTVYDGQCMGGNWQEFTFPAFNARYIKLVIDFPKSAWRQLGEMRLFTTTLTNLSKQAGELTQIGDVPLEWSVSNNYPNPFNPETHIQFSIPQAGHVTAKVYNMLGQQVRTLIDTEVPAGTCQVIWDSRSDSGESMPTGIYYLRFDFNGRFITKKVVLAR